MDIRNKNKVVFLDRDGTINVEKNYLYKIEDFEYIDGAIEALKLLLQYGYLLVIITNQSGIARGYYTEKQCQELNDWMLADLAKEGIDIAKIYYCPHHPNGIIPEYKKNCDCRKPNVGLFRQAEKELQIDMNKSYAIGDKMRDLAICDVSGVTGILLGSISGQVLPKDGYLCSNLLQAARLIIHMETEKGS